MSEISVWFTDVLRWRRGAALVWSIALTPSLVYAAVAVSSINLLHPFDWIATSLLRVFSLWTWPYIFVFLLAVAVLAVQNAKQFSVVPVIHSTRWSRLVSIVHLRSLYYIAWSVVLCGLLAWSYSNLVQNPYNNLSVKYKSDDEALFLNEHHLFLVLHGIYVGTCYKLLATMSGQNHLVFPVVQQSKFFQIKRNALASVMKSCFQTLHRLKYFYVLYYLLLGSIVQNFFAKNFGLEVRMETTKINTLSGLLDVSLLWHSVLCGTLILSLLSFSTQLFKLYHTEWHQFIIETTIEKYRNLCLHNALGCQNNTVQYLGYQDFCMLSKNSVSRRQQIFSLTQLGGHPQNWTNVSNECLGLLKGFVDEIKTYNVKVMADGSMKHLVGENGLTTTTSSATNGLTHRIVPDGNTTNTTMTTKVAQPTAVQMLVADLKKKKIVTFFIAEDPDACSRKLFAKSQLYIWAVDALSHLTSASYSEDNFGVVQKDLQYILETLLNLQEQVEKHFRLVASIGKRPENECNQDTDAALRNALKNTLKAALYRIIKTFDTHIRSVPLSGEHLRRLNHFLDYKE